MNIKSTLLLLMAFILVACNKDEDVTKEMGAKLSFSIESVLFDTVFTSIGSTSRRLKIYNKNEKAINISLIKLMGGNTSSFSININGQASSEVNDLKINGNDSINVFVKVGVNPTSENLPFLVQDSIQFHYNGNKKTIPLVAFGQNANFITNVSITNNVVWDSRLPYLVYKSVTIEEGAMLTIPAGRKILFHNNATMNVKGTLIVEGSKNDSVLFAGDRLEKMYVDEPGQWNGIHFFPKSRNSKINYAIIKNGVAAITTDSLSNNNQPKLILSNSIVKNMEVVGFLGYQADFAAFNNLFYNCGQYLLYGVGGGNYNLKHNTFGGFSLNFSRKTAAVYLSDYINDAQSNSLTLDVQNNIIWGPLISEFVVAKRSPTTLLISIVKNNILKSIESDYLTTGNIFNDPLFVQPHNGNFKLAKNSPALNKGLDLSNDPYFIDYLKKDLNNNVRIFPSELGCYENN